MQPKTNIRLGLGFLILAGTPPYLVYDVHRLTHGEANFFHWLSLILAGGAIIASILWLFGLRGESYLRLRSYWERLLAAAALVVCSPVLMLTAILIRLESDGPVIYSQKRIGRNRRKGDRRYPNEGTRKSEFDSNRRSENRRERDSGGRPFSIYKLRSMIADAEEHTGAAWSTGDRDPRVTKVGHFIRKTHLDECPQFFNVLRGQMSIIGPRPERLTFIQELSKSIEGYRDRLCVPPGITGLAQVRQTADETLDDVMKKLEYDKEYIENICLLQDIKITFQTIALVFSLLLSTLEGRVAERIEPKPAEVIVPERVAVHRR